MFFLCFVPSSCEVHSGCQSRLCEGPVHCLPLQGGSATGQQGPAGEPAQVHAGTLVIGSQILTKRCRLIVMTQRLSQSHLKITLAQKKIFLLNILYISPPPPEILSDPTVTSRLSDTKVSASACIVIVPS